MNRHAVQVVAEFQPGGVAGKHTHPGEELSYVLEGTLELQIAGKGHAKVLATYIVEKGKPLASPAY